MANAPYEAPNRRPLTSRELPVFQSLATTLVRHGISANAISMGSVVFAILAAVSLLGTLSCDAMAERCVWLVAATSIQLRLLANLLDGMVAVESGQASPLGELFNEIPDRISDVAILGALGFVSGSDVHLGYSAALLSVFVAYIRAMGGVSGAGQAFSGVMGKPHRMFLVTVLCLFQAIAPDAWRRPFLPHDISAPGVVLGLICLGCLLTARTRLRDIANKLNATS